MLMTEACRVTDPWNSPKHALAPSLPAVWDSDSGPPDNADYDVFLNLTRTAALLGMNESEAGREVSVQGVSRVYPDRGKPPKVCSAQPALYMFSMVLQANFTALPKGISAEKEMDYVQDSVKQIMRQVS
jgi:hypothetical protein